MLTKIFPGLRHTIASGRPDSSRLALSAGALVLCALAAGNAGAATANGTFQVTANIISSCTISGATLNFGGSIDPVNTSAPVDGTSNLTIRCSNTTPYTITLDAGANAGGAGNFAARSMISGVNKLAYQLYTDVGRTSVWGDGTAASTTVTGAGSGAVQTRAVYGRLPSISTAIPGGYTDTVTVVITY